MITITNGKEKFIIDEKKLKKEKNYLNYLGSYDYCEIVMSFVYEKKFFKKSITKIQKCLASAGSSRGDVIKEYVNKGKTENEIVLNENDYKEVERLFKNMSVKDTKRKEVVISAFSIIMAYECYRYIKVSELKNKGDIDFIFDYVCSDSMYYIEKMKYKNAIIKKAKEILKTEYNFDLDEIVGGGSKL